jgi:type IV secretory pathway TrbD component
MRVLKAAVLYFAMVFGFGFVFGTIRTLWLVPRVGVRAGELMEMPLMLIVIIVAARFISRTLLAGTSVAVRLAVGGIALVLMMGAEFGFVLWLRGISLRQYLATRDPVSGTAYYVLLGLFAILPGLFDRTKKS